MAQANWTFEGTPTATLQAIHDAFGLYLQGNRGAGAILQSTTLGRALTTASPMEQLSVLSILSNELKRRSLPQGAQNDIYDVTFGDGPGPGSPSSKSW